SGYVTRILWAVEQLAELRPIHTTLQDRARYSEPAAAVLQAIQADLSGQLRRVMSDHVAPARLEAVTSAIFIFVQGLLALPLSPTERQRQLRFILRELVG